MPNVVLKWVTTILLVNDNLLARVNDTLWRSGVWFLQSDIKSRIYYPNHALVGLTDAEMKPLLWRIFIMLGRDDATIQSLAQYIADTIKAHLQAIRKWVPVGSLQICVNSHALKRQLC